MWTCNKKGNEREKEKNYKFISSSNNTKICFASAGKNKLGDSHKKLFFIVVIEMSVDYKNSFFILQLCSLASSNCLQDRTLNCHQLHSFCIQNDCKLISRHNRITRLICNTSLSSSSSSSSSSNWSNFLCLFLYARWIISCSRLPL